MNVAQIAKEKYHLTEEQLKQFEEYNSLGKMLENSIANLDLTHVGHSNYVMDRYVEKTKQKGFKKPFGSNANHYFKNSIFVDKLSDTQYIIYKQPLRVRSGHSVFYNTLTEFSTSRGLHYVLKNTASNVEYVFSSHFLDRFSERTFGSRASRKDAIQRLFKLFTVDHYFYDEPIATQDIIYDHSFEAYLEQGMGIGRMYSLPDGTMRNYIQTFVSLDMMYPDQLERHAQAYLDGLN